MPGIPKRAKRDKNERQIILDLRAIGAGVIQISIKGVCDLLVGHINNLGIPTNYLIEIKQPGEGLTEDESEFFRTWPGQKGIAHNTQEALAIIGVIAE